MKVYCIFTVETNEHGVSVVKWLAPIYLFRDVAFEKAKAIGKTACVMQLDEKETWNYDQMLMEEDF